MEIERALLRLVKKINIFKECREYNLGLWQCPSFVFFIIGLLNIAAMVGTYLIAKRYTEPHIVALIVIGVTALIFIIGHSIAQGFDKLAQANKMKVEFISIASHQLRTPLSAIRWMINLLTDGQLGGLNEQQANYISLIKENNERMVKLINDLLDVSRIEMEKYIIEPKQINIFVSLQKIINDFALVAKANNIKITLEAPETLPNIYADEKINLVIQNLIDNAIKYTENKGEISVKVETNKKFITVAIKDNGVGIPETQQKFIFQKFFRSDNIMKHQTIGTGLGLFIAKVMIEKNKGRIWFESREGEGTTFYFTLPIYK